MFDTLTIFFSIVKRQGKCGSYSLLCLECIGCFLPRLGKPFWGEKGLLWVRSGGQLGMRALYACFGQLGVLSMQKLKAFFVYLLWSESKLFIKDGPSMLIDFIDWIGSR